MRLVRQKYPQQRSGQPVSGNGTVLLQVKAQRRSRRKATVVPTPALAERPLKHRDASTICLQAICRYVSVAEMRCNCHRDRLCTQGRKGSGRTDQVGQAVRHVLHHDALDNRACMMSGHTYRSGSTQQTHEPWLCLSVPVASGQSNANGGVAAVVTAYRVTWCSRSSLGP